MPLHDDRFQCLTVHRAFVVQFYSHIEVSMTRAAGRIEHIVSGKVTSFDSLEALMAFISQILWDINDASREQGK